MVDEVPELTAHLGYWLRQVSNHVSHAFARKVAGEGVTVAEWAVLRVLYGTGPVAPSQLADEMGLTRGAISKLADRLVGKGLVAREASFTDGRAQVLRLTARGAGLVPALAALAERNEAECFGHLRPADRAALRRILQEAVGRLGIREMPVS
jgi:DNA-binding MarR family transcriptional regulator